MSYVIFLSAPVGAAAMLPSRSYNYCILLLNKATTSGHPWGLVPILLRESNTFPLPWYL